MEELYNKVESLINSVEYRDLKVLLILYKRSITKLLKYYNSDNSYLRNRLINDNIFSELVFDKIEDSINKGNYNSASILLKKESVRLRLMLFYFDRGLYDNDVITQDKALDILVDYHKADLKKKGFKLYKKHNYNDIGLTDRDITRISCMVVHPAFIDDNIEKVK